MDSFSFDSLPILENWHWRDFIMDMLSCIPIWMSVVLFGALFLALLLGLLKVVLGVL